MAAASEPGRGCARDGAVGRAAAAAARTLSWLAWLGLLRPHAWNDTGRCGCTAVRGMLIPGYVGQGCSVGGWFDPVVTTGGAACGAVSGSESSMKSFNPPSSVSPSPRAPPSAAAGTVVCVPRTCAGGWVRVEECTPEHPGRGGHSPGGRRLSLGPRAACGGSSRAWWRHRTPRAAVVRGGGPACAPQDPVPATPSRPPCALETRRCAGTRRTTRGRTSRSLPHARLKTGTLDSPPPVGAPSAFQHPRNQPS